MSVPRLHCFSSDSAAVTAATARQRPPIGHPAWETLQMCANGGNRVRTNAPWRTMSAAALGMSWAAVFGWVARQGCDHSPMLDGARLAVQPEPPTNWTCALPRTTT
jgi:hypothetical protein